MKKELSVSMSVASKARMFVQQTGECLANIYSTLLEGEISANQAWKVLHANLAFIFAVFSTCNVWVHFLLAVWFLFTIWDCKKSGLK